MVKRGPKLKPERQALIDNMTSTDLKEYNEATSTVERCRILNQLQHGKAFGSPQVVEKEAKRKRAKRDAKRGTPAPPLLSIAEKAAFFLLVRESGAF